MSSLISSLYKFGEFVLDPQSRVLRRSGTTVALTPKAFDVLLLLVQNTGETVTKDELMKRVWPDSFVEESNLTQTIFMVRKALDETAERRYILTVQGRGYRFLVPVTETDKSGPEVQTGPAVPDERRVPEIRPGSHGPVDSGERGTRNRSWARFSDGWSGGRCPGAHPDRSGYPSARSGHSNRSPPGLPERS